MEQQNIGAYLLTIELPNIRRLQVGRLGNFDFRAGTYIYVGSAKRGLSQRVARHARLAGEKTGNRHWHVDYLLLHPESILKGAELYPGSEECVMSAKLAKDKGVEVPIPGFGSTDCQSGCQAHLYLLK